MVKKTTKNISKLAREAAKARTTVQQAPVTIGTSLSSVTPLTREFPGGMAIAGREFLGNVVMSSSSNFQLGALVPLHPAYYSGSMVGNICRTWEQYRFRSVTVHFVSRQPTSVTGQIALCVTREILEPCENGSNAAFLGRVMSRGMCSIGPLWRNHSVVVECDGNWRNIDAFVGSDYDDNVMCEMQAYVQASSADTAGYLLIDYEIEYRKPMYQPHSSSLPLTTGVGTSYTLVDSSSTPTANNAVQLNNASLSALPNGTIWRFILSIDQSTLATGTTAANAWNVGTTTSTNLTTISTTGSNITLSNGQALYIAVLGTALYAYASYEQALAGTSSGQLFYRTTGSTAGSFVGIAYQLRLGNAIVMFAQ